MSDAKDHRVLKKDLYDIASGIVIVKVGTKKRAFHIHESLLARSTYFRNALAAHESAGNLQLDLWEDDEDATATFTVYVHLLYYGKVASKVVAESGAVTTDLLGSEQAPLVRLYIMAQWLGDDDAMNTTIAPSTEAVSIAYQGTPTDSPLRRLLVDMYIWGAPEDYVDDEMPSEFVLGLARAALKKLGMDYHKGSTQATCCDYHQHGEDTPCSSRKRKREVDDSGSHSGSDTEDDYENEDENR